MRFWLEVFWGILRTEFGVADLRILRRLHRLREADYEDWSSGLKLMRVWARHAKRARARCAQRVQGGALAFVLNILKARRGASPLDPTGRVVRQHASRDTPRPALHEGKSGEVRSYICNHAGPITRFWLAVNFVIKIPGAVGAGMKPAPAGVEAIEEPNRFVECAGEVGRGGVN